MLNSFRPISLIFNGLRKSKRCKQAGLDFKQAMNYNAKLIVKMIKLFEN